jgi:hypothetical protein
MNALARWKILLALIATFAAGAITGGFLIGRVTKDAVRRAEQPRPSGSIDSELITAAAPIEAGTGRQDRFDPDANGE